MSPMSTDLDMSQQGPPGEGWTQKGTEKVQVKAKTGAGCVTSNSVWGLFLSGSVAIRIVCYTLQNRYSKKS